MIVPTLLSGNPEAQRQCYSLKLDPCILVLNFHFIPLVRSLVLLRNCFLPLVCRMYTSHKLSKRKSYKSRVRSLRIPQQPQTSTVVDMKDLSPPPITPPGILHDVTKQASKQPTTSFVQFQDLEDPDPPSSAHKTSDEIRDLEGLPGSRRNKLHILAAKVLNFPKQDRRLQRGMTLNHVKSNPDVDVKIRTM